MGEVICLTGPQFRPRRVEITDSRVGDSRIYYVDLFEKDRSRVGLHCSPSYPLAVKVAVQASRDFAVPLHDLVGCSQ
jgi:hypothetical protein